MGLDVEGIKELFDVSKAKRPNAPKISLEEMDKLWEETEVWEETEEEWGADETGTPKGTLKVTLVYGGQSHPPEYLGYDLVDWDNSKVN